MIKGIRNKMSRFAKVLTIITLGICLALPAVTSMLVRADDALPEVNVLKIPSERVRNYLFSKLPKPVRKDPTEEPNPTAKLADGQVKYATSNLYDSDIETLKNLTSANYFSIDREGISDLTGIEYLPNATMLSITNNHSTTGIETVDLSALQKLKTINLSFNKVKKLTLGSKPELTELKIDNNELTEIDLSGCPNLTTLTINDNKLTSLDLTANPKIKNLTFSNNQISNLKLADSSTLTGTAITGQVQNLTDQWIAIDFKETDYSIIYLNEIFTQAQINNMKSFTGVSTNEYDEPVVTSPRNDDWKTTGIAKFTRSQLVLARGFDVHFGIVTGTLNTDYVNMHITAKEGFIHRFSSNDTTLGTVDLETFWIAKNEVGTKFQVTATPKEGCSFKHWIGPDGRSIESIDPVLSIFPSKSTVSYQAIFYVDKNNNNIPDEEEGNLIIKDTAGNIVNTFPNLLRANAVIMFDNAGNMLEEFEITASETVRTFSQIDKKVLIGATGELNSDNKFEVKPIYGADRNSNGTADDAETHYQVEQKASDFGSVTMTPNKDLLIGDEVTLTVKANKNYILKTILVNGHDIGKVNSFMIDNAMLADTRAAVGTIIVEAIFEEDMNNDGTPDSEQTKYSVSVDKDGEGDASANVTQAVEGRDVRLIAQPKAGYEFKGWKSNDVKITNGKFIMPKKAVKITAIFEKNPGGVTTGTITLKPNPSGEQPTHNSDGTITIPNHGVVVLPSGMEVTLPKGGTMLQDGTVSLPEDGSVVYPNGKKVILEDGGTLYANGTIRDKNGDVVMTLPNGGSTDTIIIKPNPGGEQPSKNPNGTITIPNESIVIIVDGNEITLPNGGTMLLDGSVSIPVGGSVVYPNGKKVVLTDGGVLHVNGTLTDNSGNILITLPTGGSTGKITMKPNPDGSQPIANPNGTTSIPSNSVIVLSDGKEVTLPNGGTILLDGTVAIPFGGTVVYPDGRIAKAPKGGILHANGTLTDLDGNIIMTMSNVTPDVGGPGSGGTITIKPNPDGEQPVQNPDGTITIPKKSVVLISGGLEVTLPDGGTMLLNGTVSIPAGGRVIYPNGKVVTLPNGGILHANGTITDLNGNIITTLPKTGDHTARDMYLGLAVISMVGIGFVLYRTKFEKQ